jgi:hypothetical protein
MSGGLGFEQAPVPKTERPVRAASFLSRVAMLLRYGRCLTTCQAETDPPNVLEHIKNRGFGVMRPNNPVPGYFPDSGILFPVRIEKFPVTTPREFARNRLI